MVSSRERQRTTRRRIAGERTRTPTGGPTEAPPAQPAEPVRAPVEDEPAGATVREEPAAPEADDQDAVAAEPVEAAVEEPADQATDQTTSEVTDKATDQATDQQGETPAAAVGRLARRLAAPLLGDDDASGPPNWVLAVLAGLLVAALALDGFVVWREVSHRQDAENAARAMHSAVVEAPSVAEKAAEQVLSYRYDRLPQDLADARQFLTDDYAPNYVNTIRKLVAGSAQHLKVTVQAKVLASGVSEAGPNRADVLLFVDQKTTSAAETPKTALNRVVFTMVRQDGQWKVDEIQAF